MDATTPRSAASARIASATTPIVEATIEVAEATTAIGVDRGPLWMRAVAAFVGALPRALLGLFGVLIGWVAGSVLRLRRRAVVAAMARAGIPRPSATATSMYASLGKGLIELLWLAGRAADAIDPLVVVTPKARAAIARAAARGRGVILATAHTGNWDLAACAMARGEAAAGRRFHVVTKRLSWRALDCFWQHLRASRGVGLIGAHGAYRRARAALGRGDVVAMLVDQAPERASGVGVFPFLGAPARHDLAPALLAARSGAPIVLALTYREADGRHVIDVALEIDACERGGETPEAVAAKIAGALEGFIRAHADQWLWLHRRWKGTCRSRIDPARPRLGAAR